MTRKQNVTLYSSAAACSGFNQDIQVTKTDLTAVVTGSKQYRAVSK